MLNVTQDIISGKVVFKNSDLLSYLSTGYNTIYTYLHCKAKWG